jgi:hypothetical protein
MYEEIAFSSASGLNEALQVSKPGVGDRIRDAISGQAGNNQPTNP